MFRLNLILLMVSISAFSPELSVLTISPVPNFSLGTNGEQFPQCNFSYFRCYQNASTESRELTLVPMRDAIEDMNASDANNFMHGTMGRAIVNVQLQDVIPDRWLSFNSTFSFSIESGSESAGDGLMFALLSDHIFSGSAGGSFGVYGERDGTAQVVRTLAVEFDTFQNRNSKIKDISSNHVGVDTDYLESVISRDANETNINLTGGVIFAWIDYNSSSTVLEVRINTNSSRPVQAFLKWTVPLSERFQITAPIYLAITASNGDLYSFYTVYNWTFHAFKDNALLQEVSPGPAPTSASSSKIPLIAGVISGSIVMLAGSAVILCFLYRRKSFGDSQQRSEESPGEFGDLGELRLAGIADSVQFSFHQLSEATEGFSEDYKLGQGGFGSVYRGKLPNTGQLVAVKRLSTDSHQGSREFKAEVSIISQLRHRNIVKLLGWCMEKGNLLLVYELVANGSLDKALFHPVEGSVLEWKTRFKIITGAAEALLYLHENSRKQIIHRDFKTSNIMLDEDFNAMLGDFGLARMVERDQNPATTFLAGTYGYIAPEAPSGSGGQFTGKFTEKTDVFAFGAVALEVACGRLVFSPLLPKEVVLVDWVWENLSQGTQLSVVDQNLQGEFDRTEMEVLLLLGLLCSHPDPNERPKMRHVVEILKGSVGMLPVPRSKPVTKYQSDGPRYTMPGLKPRPTTDSLTSIEEHSQVSISTSSSNYGYSGALSQSASSVLQLSESSAQSASSANTTDEQPLLER